MKIEVYCDESRQDLLHNKKSISSNNRYASIGGIWIDSKIRENFKNDIKVLQKKYNTFGEIKWQNVCNSRYDFYQAVIDLFFEYELNIMFRCIVVDALKVNVKKYHNSDAELGFYKFYYQLIYHWLDNNKKYYIYTDYKKNRKNNRILELKTILNTASHSPCVKHIQAINSKESLILQVEDVLMGAVGYKYNYGYEGKSAAKNKIVGAIEKKIGLPINNTSRAQKKFNVFEIHLMNRGGI